MPMGGLLPYDDQIPLAGEGDVGPLDVSDILPTPQPQQPQQTGSAQREPRRDKRSWLKLAALIPAALKGGAGAMEGLMQGFQQAELQRQQTAQQDFERQRLLGADQRAQAELHLRQQDLARRVEEQRGALIKEFSTAMMSQELADPEAVRALTQLYEARGRVLGLRPGAFETTAMQVLKPAQLLQRRIRQHWNNLTAAERERHMSGPWVMTLPGGQQIPNEEWRAAVGGFLDPATGEPPKQGSTAGVPGTGEFSIVMNGLIDEFTHTNGRPPNPTERVELMQQAGQMAGAASDPQMAEINRQLAELRLRNAQQPSTAELTPAQFRTAQALADDFERASQDYLTRAQSYQTITAAAQQPSAAGDLSMIFAFMKMLDPGSVVREGEQATAQNTAGVPERIRNLYNRVMTGERLTPSQREDFLTQARAQLRQAQGRQRALTQAYTTRARRMGLPPDFVVIDYDAVFGLTDEEPSPSPQPAPANPEPSAATGQGGRRVGRFEIVGEQP